MRAATQESRTSPAAGHVFAQTGTFAASDLPNHQLFITGKGLVGYIVTPKGYIVAFSAYVNLVPVHGDPAAGLAMAGEALGEIASDVYDDASANDTNKTSISKSRKVPRKRSGTAFQT
jgi:D-alanyl-D-alanine carboxypeptidase